jgi:hypothetical protein
MAGNAVTVEEATERATKGAVASRLPAAGRFLGGHGRSFYSQRKDDHPLWTQWLTA